MTRSDLRSGFILLFHEVCEDKTLNRSRFHGGVSFGSRREGREGGNWVVGAAVVLPFVEAQLSSSCWEMTSRLLS
jgi:hypothetical protein